MRFMAARVSPACSGVAIAAITFATASRRFIATRLWSTTAACDAGTVASARATTSGLARSMRSA